MSEQTIATRFAVNTFVHIAAGAALYAWQILGIERAGNVFVFWMWFVGVLFFVSFLALPNPPKKRARKNRVLLCLNLSAWLFFTGALVWLGYVFLPSVLVFGLIGTHALESKYDDEGNLRAKEGTHV